jgi:hypothetical protein
VQTARLSAAEFGGSNSDAEADVTRDRRHAMIALTDIDCAQLEPKTGNIKLE